MVVEQLKDVLTTVVNEILTPETPMTAEDITKVIDVGTDPEDFLGSANLDSFVSTLVNQVGKIVVDTRSYVANTLDIVVDEWDWGSYLERIYFAPMKYDTDNSFNLSERVYDDVLKFVKPDVSAKVFSERKAFSVPVCVSTVHLKEAFTSMEKMNTFVTGIYVSVENSMSLATQILVKMLLQSGIAISDRGTETAVHLVTEYNTETGLAVTDVGALLQDEKFLKWVVARIGLTREYLREYSSSFNDGTLSTFTPDNEQKLVLLSLFAKKVSTNVLASAFNKGELTMGEYDTMGYWQGTFEEGGNPFALATVSKVTFTDAKNKLGAGAFTTEAPYSKANVIGFLFDKKALGISFTDKRVTSTPFNADGEFFKDYHKQNGNYIIDKKYPMVAFILD